MTEKEKNRRDRPGKQTNKKQTDAEQPAAPEAVIRKVLESSMGKLAERELSVSDFIKLLQLRRELESESVREIEVRWVDGSETDSASKP